MRRREVAAPEPLLPLISQRSGLIFAATALLLLAPWPRYGRLCAAGFRLFGNGVIRVLDLGGPAQPRFSEPLAAERQPPAVDDWTVMLSAVGGPRESERLPLSTRILGYTPFAIFVALLAAWPVAGRRRRKAAAVGAAILFVRLAIAIALPVGRAFGRGDGEPGGGLAAEMAWTSLVDQPALSYVSPLLAWGIGLLSTSPRAPARAHRKS
jgi:hypothetical protein